MSASGLGTFQSTGDIDEGVGAHSGWLCVLINLLLLWVCSAHVVLWL